MHERVADMLLYRSLCHCVKVFPIGRFRFDFRHLVSFTRQGRVFLISDPSVGSSRTHQTSPRRGVIPWLRRLAFEFFKFLFNGPYLTVVIRHLHRASQ